ncbi:MAG: PaaI family thioesterase [Caldilineaceae bacterium]|nr:PaaI family thioesterase [Caldilineaceae bacterium]MBP8110398.1 PaaI family thioesterase [Caldilineaceae bacterium]MBP8125482.1 PaaI family thioesterase [Caldilineaceae bacterium]MBP9074978.1 PaaI family thioesterase [Caldilineaceae bacterium]
MNDSATADLIARLSERATLGLPGHLGLQVVDAESGRCELAMPLAEYHVAPNGYLHAGSVVTLADTACGFGCVVSLPTEANGFTTIELKTNFLGTATQGTLRCVAKMEHGGSRTQVWDATVYAEDGKRIALFRCTQMILYPKS